jgi:hypothetical protein
MDGDVAPLEGICEPRGQLDRDDISGRRARPGYVPAARRPLCANRGHSITPHSANFRWNSQVRSVPILLQKLKIEQPQNLAKVDPRTSAAASLSAPLGRSVIDFG